MKNFDATVSDAPVHCYYCGRLIADWNWFGRFKLGNDCIALCRPHCVESLFDHPDRCAGVEARPQPAGASDLEFSFNRQAREARDRVVVGSSEACAS